MLVLRKGALGSCPDSEKERTVTQHITSSISLPPKACSEVTYIWPNQVNFMPLKQFRHQCPLMLKKKKIDIPVVSACFTLKEATTVL